jgi:hypothetical protein
MSKQLSNVLSDFPETDAFSAIRFYLRYIYSDLTKIAEKVDELEALDFQQPYSLKIASEEFPYLLYGSIDFNIYFRIADSLVNLGQFLSKPDLIELGESLIHQGNLWNESKLKPPSVFDEPEKLVEKLRNLSIELRKIVNETEKTTQYKLGNGGGFNLLEKTLKEMAERYVEKIMPLSIDIYLQSWGLFRREYPEEAREEDFWEMIYTPLHEDYHPHALELDACPRCGAVLTRNTVFGHSTDEERGKYCESCRSRWIQFMSANPLT